jgi:hypothetical protein
MNDESKNKPKKPIMAFVADYVCFSVLLFLSIFVFYPYASTMSKYIPALYNVGLYKTIIYNVHVVKLSDNPPQYILSNGEKLKFNKFNRPLLDCLLSIILIFFPCAFIWALLHIFINKYICEDFDKKVQRYNEKYQNWKAGKCTNNDLNLAVTEKNKKLNSSDGSITWQFVIFILTKIRNRNVTFLTITYLEWIIIFFIVLVAIILTFSYFL